MPIVELGVVNGLFGTRWFSWQRLACLVVTTAILAWLFQRIDTAALYESLGRVHPAWFAAALMLYGCALILGGWRWHVTLHAIRCAVRAGASVRFSFIGHFFFLMLFGVPAGDVAKSALYARWFQYRAPELVAAAPIDRTLGVIAALIVGCVAALVGLASGGFHDLDTSKLQIPISTFVILALVTFATAGALVFWKPRGDSWWARSWRTLRGGLRELLSSRKRLGAGLSVAIAAQMVMSAVLAFNLRAVVDEPLLWMQAAWAFPVIMMLSCLPITVAGAGVREILAMTFLGLYGVPPGDCVAAAMLTFFAKVIWALVGGVVLWQEFSAQKRHGSVPNPESVSVIIPALNESDSLPDTIAHIRRNDFICEIIVVDGGSTDGTPGIAEKLGCQVLSSRAGRGVQMRAGAQIARGDVVLLLHADTWLPPHATRAMLDCLRDRTVVAGGFWKAFRESPFLLLGSKWKCGVRLWAGRRIAGDQAMFIRRDTLEAVGGIPEIALMEEFVMCRRLQRVGRLALADAIVLTSARRFLKQGILRTYLRMWRVSTRYRLGTEPGELRKLYDKE